MSSNCKKRKSFSIQEKISIIKEVENGKKQAVICKERNLASSTLATILKNRERIMNSTTEFSSKVKKLRSASNVQLDKAVLTWFKVNRESNVPISGAMLKEKAQQFSEQIDNGNAPELKWSNGWLNRFKSRHNINCGKICGEAKSVPQECIENWLSNIWPKLREKYSDQNIFNADELGLFYKLTPDKTLKFKDESCKGGKLSKERITVLVCANMTGSEKLKLLVIGKSANPRCFRGVKSLPVDYKSNRRAWMTSAIFETMLRAWDRKLHRKILLLVDNCTAHPKIENLRNIQLEFLPPNVTSVLQPMDQGIIRSLKSHYRKLLVRRLVQDLEEEKHSKISLLDAINYIHKAWSLVEIKAIKNCFEHARWRKVEFDEEDDLPLAEWINLPTNEINDTDDNEFIKFNENIATCASLTDEDIIEEACNEKETNKSDSEDELEVSDVEVSTSLPSFRQVQKSLNTVRDFLLLSNCTPYHDALFSNLTCLENGIDTIKQHYTQIGRAHV